VDPRDASAPASPKRQQVPQVLEYRPKSEDAFRWPRLPGAVGAAIVVFVFPAIGLALGYYSHGAGGLTVFPIIGGALWYVGNRVNESSAVMPIKAIKFVSALTATAMSPALLTGDVSPFWAAEVYGWTSELAFGGPKVVTLAACICIFAVADVIDWIIRWKRWRLTKSGSPGGAADGL
jgi:hypothetical protein